MKNWIISKVLNYLAKEGYITHPDLSESLEQWIEGKIHGGSVEAWALVKNKNFLYGDDYGRYLIFDTKEDAIEWARDNPSSATHVKKMWMYK